MMHRKLKKYTLSFSLSLFLVLLSLPIYLSLLLIAPCRLSIIICVSYTSTPSAYFMKSPPEQLHDDVARERVEAFITGEDNATLTGAESDAVEEAEALLKAASEQEAVTIA